MLIFMKKASHFLPIHSDKRLSLRVGVPQVLVHFFAGPRPETRDGPTELSHS